MELSKKDTGFIRGLGLSLFTIMFIVGVIFAVINKPLNPVELVNENVFMVVNSEGKEGHASAFAITNGYLVTANHVCELFKNKEYVEVKGLGYKKILAVNITDDICLLEGEKSVKGLKLQFNYRQFEPVFSINFQGHYKIKSIHYGHISGIYDLEDISFIVEDEIQYEICASKLGKIITNGHQLFCLFSYKGVVTTALGLPGASGSPMVNEDGEVLGVNRSIITADRSLIFMESVKIKSLIDAHENAAKK